MAEGKSKLQVPCFLESSILTKSLGRPYEPIHHSASWKEELSSDLGRGRRGLLRPKSGREGPAPFESGSWQH